MCGIAGFFGTSVSGDPSVMIDRMLSAISHRGPDGKGKIVFNNAGFGHVRLAVIDLETGGQPMSSADGSHHITYNGEIYNYREIREILIKKGAAFRTESDTEVVLSSFQHLGISALEKFRGMFAFAVWDDHKKEGFLVRDSFGIKPLYYCYYENRIIFGSEIKAILCALRKKPGLALDSLHLLMNFRYIPGEKTLFDGIFSLPPGHYLRWEDNKFSIHRWADEPEQGNSRGDLGQIREYLVRAVQRQLVSDVPLGAYLSAGMDSATVLALSIKDNPAKKPYFPTFTIQTGDSPQEARQAAATARHYGVPNFQESVNFTLGESLTRLIWHLEVPKVNAFQSALVARLARKHVKVALSGLGGDEIFLGYNIHRILAQLAQLNNPVISGIGKLFGKAANKMISWLGLRYEEFARAGSMLKAVPDFRAVYGILRNVWDSPENRKRIYGPEMLNSGLQDAFSEIQNQWPAAQDPVSAAARFEISNKMVNDLLLQEDRLSMAFGLEVRVPFLDEDLVSLLSSIDRRFKIPKGELKKLMKEAISEWVPETITSRPKSGFQVPIHIFFNTHLRPLAGTYLSRTRLEKDGLFSPDFVEQILAARPHFRLRWHYFLLYLIIGTNVWLDIFQNDKTIPHWP